MFTDRERAIFKFFNGARQVWADPLRVQRKLYAALGDPDAVFAASRSPEPVVAAAALDQLVDAARDAFRMTPFSEDTGEGATDEDCLAAVTALWQYLELKKKPTAACPTS